MAWGLFVTMLLAEWCPGPNVLGDGILPSRRSNPWGPESNRARARGLLPAIRLKPEEEAWDRWGRDVLKGGDLVFRLGDVRVLWGYFPLSWYIARATGSRFSHVGLVAIEEDGPIVYDCGPGGVQRQPFALWRGDNVGAFGVKRLKLEQRAHIAGAIEFCRRAYEAQVPFDFEFSPADDKLYCVELIEKAFRSQGLALSEPVRVGDWQNIRQFPLTSLTIIGVSSFVLKVPISLEQPVYVPGNDHQGIWGSRWLDHVAFTPPHTALDTASPMPDGLGVRGDISIILYVLDELRWPARDIRVVRSLMDLWSICLDWERTVWRSH